MVAKRGAGRSSRSPDVRLFCPYLTPFSIDSERFLVEGDNRSIAELERSPLTSSPSIIWHASGLEKGFLGKIPLRV